MIQMLNISLERLATRFIAVFLGTFASLMRLFYFFLFIVIVEIYAFQAVRTLVRSRKGRWVYIFAMLALYMFIAYEFMQFDRSVGQTRMTMFVTGLFLLSLVPKILLALVMAFEDISRLLGGAFGFVSGGGSSPKLPSRRKFISRFALGLAAVPFLSLIYGMTKGKYNFRVISQQVFFPDLPDAFEGFKILQISDTHAGSFDNAEKIDYAISLINDQQADMMVFTGDMVNSLASEMDPWIKAFQRIRPFEHGKFAVLGNHDYGEYLQWNTDQDKQDNFEAIKRTYGLIGFDLLLNENRRVQKNGQQIAVVGVENWGAKFKKAGDLALASRGLKPQDFKVVLTHDSSHWEHEIKTSPQHFQLTFSGHTHGMQFGIEIPGFLRWSPVQYVYKQWAGLYEHLNRYIYVNRGFGFHAYPGRVGIWPEITVLELKKSKNSS